MKLKQLLPKGKYNGQTIHGFRISFAFKLLRPKWKPIASFNFGEPCFIWMWFTLRFYVEYDGFPRMNVKDSLRED